MSDEYSPQDLSRDQELLAELFEEVTALESPLDTGEALSLGQGGSALDILNRSRVAFGNPRDRLIPLTKEKFDQANVELTEGYQLQMLDQFDFYYMTLTVRLWPERGTQWRLFECRLDFGPKGANEPIVQNYFPKRAWHEVLKWGGGMHLGLTGNLEWQAGVDMEDLPAAVLEKLPGQVKASMVNRNEMKSFITMPDYSFALGRPEIEAAGAGGSECLWRLQSPDLQKTQSIELEVVFKVAKGTKSIELIGLATAEPKVSWLTESLSNVAELLSRKLQDILLRATCPRIGAHEKWTITLPS